MSLDPLLLEILVDPEDKEPLYYLADESILYNPRLRRTYAIEGSIPVMLIEDATNLDDAEAARLEARLASATKTGTRGAS